MKLAKCSPPKINRSLLPAKAAYFFFYFSYSSVTPYIAVFITAYGLNAEQAGFILGARLFAQFLSAPIWGAIADKTQKFRFLLLLQIVVSSIITFTAPWIPRALPQTSPDNGVILTTIAPHTYAGNFTNNVQNITSFTSTLPTMTNANNSQVFTENNNELASKIPTFSTFNQTSATTKINADNGAQNSIFPTTNGKHVQKTDPQINNKRKNKNKHAEYEKPGTRNLFILMIVWFSLIGAFDGGIPLLIDNSVMDTIARLGKSDFGKQRLWGAVGFGLAAFASGVGIQLSGEEEPNYFTMFYIFLGSNFCLFISCLFLKMKPAQSDSLVAEEGKKRNLGKSLLKEFKKFNVSFFFLTTFIMGICNGLLYGFMFLYIEDLKGSNIIMGLSILVACSTEVMMFPVSSKVIEVLHGNLPAITLSFALYVVRFTGFSFLHNAWFILLLQLLHSVCFALFWAAAVYHTTSLAPEGLQATFLGILNGLFFGIAGGVSGVFGGMVYNHFGGRNLWRVFAIICAVWTLFMALHVLERRNHRIKKEKRSSDQEMQQNAEAPAAESLLAATDA